MLTSGARDERNNERKQRGAGDGQAPPQAVERRPVPCLMTARLGAQPALACRAWLRALILSRKISLFAALVLLISDSDCICGVCPAPHVIIT